MKLIRALVRGLICCLLFVQSFGSLANSSNNVVMGYYPFWGNFRKETAFADVRAEYLTHLVYFKLAINPDGSLDSHDYFTDYAQVQGVSEGEIVRGSYKAIELLKERNPELKVLFSIGGWDGSSYLSDIMADPIKQQQLISSILTTIEHFGFDGIEVDWRYPGYWRG